MAEKNYVVEGRTGEYSEASGWPVKAFRSEDAAQAFVTMAENWLLENELAYANYRGRCWPEETPACPFDPAFYVTYTGAGYAFYAVELV